VPDRPSSRRRTALSRANLTGCAYDQGMGNIGPERRRIESCRSASRHYAGRSAGAPPSRSRNEFLLHPDRHAVPHAR